MHWPAIIKKIFDSLINIFTNKSETTYSFGSCYRFYRSNSIWYTCASWALYDEGCTIFFSQWNRMRYRIMMNWYPPPSIQPIYMACSSHNIMCVRHQRLIYLPFLLLFDAASLYLFIYFFSFISTHDGHANLIRLHCLQYLGKWMRLRRIQK